MSVETNKIQGTALILGSSFMYSLMALLIKVASEATNSYNMAFVRFLFGLCFLSVLLLTGRIRLKFNNWMLLIARGIIGGTAVWITYLAIEKLGIFKGPLILFSYPVYASLFGVFILKEKLLLKNIAAIGLAVAGLYLLIVKSGQFDLPLSGSKYEIIAIIGSVMAGLAVTLIRKLHETESTLEIFFAQCLFGTLIMLVPANLGEHALEMSGVVLLMGIAVTALAGQLLMTEGFRYLPVNVASILAMTELILNSSIGILIFHEQVTARMGFGAVLIAAACVISLVGRVSGGKKKL